MRPATSTRKNSWAAIDAFGRAFTQGEDAHLVIKATDTLPSPESRAALARLRESVASNSAIIIREQPMTYVEVLSLYAPTRRVCLRFTAARDSASVPMEAMLLVSRS